MRLLFQSTRTFIFLAIALGVITSCFPIFVDEYRYCTINYQRIKKESNKYLHKKGIVLENDRNLILVLVIAKEVFFTVQVFW
jgi:hypothetical protein